MTIGKLQAAPLQYFDLFSVLLLQLDLCIQYLHKLAQTGFYYHSPSKCAEQLKTLSVTGGYSCVADRALLSFLPTSLSLSLSLSSYHPTISLIATVSPCFPLEFTLPLFCSSLQFSLLSSLSESLYSSIIMCLLYTHYYYCGQVMLALVRAQGSTQYQHSASVTPPQLWISSPSTSP